MIYYWNFAMDKHGFSYARTRYNAMNILGDFGGLQGSINTFFALIFSIYSYRVHKMKVLKEYENKLLNNNIFGLAGGKKWPRCISLRCWFYDKMGKRFCKCFYKKGEPFNFDDIDDDCDNNLVHNFKRDGVF